MPGPEPLVYLNGRKVPASQAHLAIYDAAIILGATVTDLTRTFRQQPYRLEDHVARFYRSCKYARIQPVETREETVTLARELIAHNASLLAPERELALVQFISPGEFRVYAGAAGAPGDLTPTYCMHTFPLPFEYWSHYYTEGVHCVTPSIRHVPPQCIDPKIKCRSRMHWWLADQEAHLVDPKAVTLCLDLDGNVTETSGSNFLIAKDNVVLSPSQRNILWGISLATVAELCAELGLGFEARELQVYDVVNADEAFLSSTPYCLAPVTRINGVEIGTGKPGPVFAKLIAAWSEKVGMDIVGQIVAGS